MLRLTMAGALLGCTAFVLFLGDVNSQTTTSYSPGPSLDSTTSGETTTTEFIPAPDSTTSFLRTFITNCSGFCNFNLLHVHAESECSCDSKCATIDYGRCCNYLEYCTAPSTTQARTNSQPDKSPSTAAPPDTSSSFIPTNCPSTCGVEGNTCDELASHFTCDDLETTQGCDCTGCLCPVVSDVSSSTLPPDPTTVLTTVPVDTTTSTTTTTTTSTTTTITTTTSTTTIPCPATCYGATCDDWVVFGGFSVNTRCTFLEREHDCDCHKCVCDDAFWSTTEDGTAPTTVALSTEPPVDDTTTSSRDDKNYGVDTSVISGGFTNSALQMYTVISGGRGNLATQEYSTVSGGLRNAVRSNYATVGAGFQNVVSGRFTTIVGGRQNAAAGRHSVVLGSGGTTTGTKLDHVLLMNFRHSSGTPVAAAVDMPNTISLQADEVYFNDVDLNALAMSARRLAESQQQIDDAVRRVDGLKSLLAERLAQLRALTA